MNNIILVSFVSNNEIDTEKSKSFTNVKQAEKYFKQLVKNEVETYNWTEDDWDDCLDDGYFEVDFQTFVYINEIELV